MAATLHDFQKPIEKELREFEPRFREDMKSHVALLDTIMRYIVRRKGKQIRPMLVFLSAKMAGEISESSYRAASMIELLHTATLVHDDVVDNSYKRRGFFSINALWKNKIAVLVGDYLLSRGLLLSLDNSEHRLLSLVSRAVREMSEGELLQIEKTRKLNIGEEVYFEIIRQKTATLFAAACACGAASVGAKDETVNQYWKLGELTGIAFQIKDDLLDFSDGDIGKPHGVDVKEKKMTLPVIYGLKNTTAATRRSIISIISRHSGDAEKVKAVHQFAIESGGVDYAKKKMNEFRTRAIELLHQLSANDAATGMKGLIEFTTERKK